MNFYEIEKKIYSLFDDEVECEFRDDFDYRHNKYNVVVKIENGTDKQDAEEYGLTISIEGNKRYKASILSKQAKIDKMINNYNDEQIWIRRENIFKTSYLDKEKYNAVLMYSIHILKEV